MITKKKYALKKYYLSVKKIFISNFKGIRTKQKVGQLTYFENMF